MILAEGLYLGRVEKSFTPEGIRISCTSYSQEDGHGQMHAHANPHYSLVLSGGNLEKRQHCEMERLPGLLTFYRSGELHQNTYKRNHSFHLNVEFEPALLKTYQVNEDILAARLSLSTSFAMLRMYKELKIDDDLSHVGIETLTLSIIAGNGDSSLAKPKWIKKLEMILYEGASATITLQQLAAETGVHPTTISKQFPRYFNCTLTEFIRRLRVQKAIGLLKSGNNALTDIAYACGFADQSHFIRCFKYYTGFLPKDFRKC